MQDFTTVTELPGSGATREQLNMQYTRYRLAAELAAGKDVLEVACGPGVGLRYLARVARKVVGGDYDPRLVEAARACHGERIDVLQMDAQQMPLPDAAFDVVLLLEAIYYLPDAARFIAEARRVLRPGGVLLICSANREWQGFNPSPFSHYYYSGRELITLLAAAGFQTSIRAGFPSETPGAVGRLLDAVRRIAVQFHLIPKTMRAKAVLKRLLFGRLRTIPMEIADGAAEFHAPVPVDTGRPLTGYKVLYAIGRRSAS